MISIEEKPESPKSNY
ncbi:MAG: hypothetical protein P8L23_00850, partial [Flavobacteriales bacterium]|nr:hypothetical protein [Flavobacteriales bacterium]